MVCLLPKVPQTQILNFRKDTDMNAPEIYQQTLRHFLKPIQGLLDDASVSEVMVVGHKNVYFERAGKIQLSEATFGAESALMAAIRNIAEYSNRRIDVNHSIDGRLPGGERVHAIVPPASRVGPCLTIRKFQKSTFDLVKLVERGSMSSSAAEFLSLCVQMHKNIVISGGTGTGKTSLLNALSTAIPENERIIVIEDSSELQLNQKHTVYLEAQSTQIDGQKAVTIRDLFVDSLRMRPDRIIVGEVRRGEALDLIQSMISGHAGSLTTVHANTPRDAARRLETLCLMNDAELPVYVARAQVASALHIVVQIIRLPDGSRRVHSIAEACGLDEKNEYTWRELYRFEAEGVDESGNLQGELVASGVRPSFADEPFRMGLGKQVVHSTEMYCPPS